ncbi:cobyrinic acid a,c-diamide synthase [Chondrocystis sp. NIES-4102]|nr:cobyrinic acid a,c-diamide synthase [Chondrocystis sp. NIES-4102]
MVSIVAEETEFSSSKLAKELKVALEKLPLDAQESIVDNNFIARIFLDALGFSLPERIPEFKTGDGAVDYALRKNIKDNNFLHDKTNPQVLVEIKGRDINLNSGTPAYKAIVKQIKRYLLAPYCQSAQWGIITNSKHIQLFRKHGKVVYPATPILEITPDNIGDITVKIRSKIEQTSRALTVAIYNNKGGVGKTTTVINLAATLTLHKQKVLVIDFDPNQRDLTDYLNVHVGKYKLYDCLKDKKGLININKVICPYIKTFKNGISLSFDVIPVDEQFTKIDEDKLRSELSFYSLRKKLETLKSDYDYILIDAPPNWRYFSISAVYAADVVLIPTQHNNIGSLKNAATVIGQYIPEIQKARQAKTQGLELGAIALPIFFNGEKITEATKVNAKNAINEIINKACKLYNFDLISYFYPNFLHSKNTSIFELPNLAFIASSCFENIPAVYKSKVAYDYYSQLAKEYFLQ